MRFPFTIEQFMQVFSDYNLGVWPIQIYLVMIASVLIVLILKNMPGIGKLVLAILGFFWLWMGVAYHLMYFTEINAAAYGFGAAAVLQSIVFFFLAFKKSPVFSSDFSTRSMAGIVLIVYSILIYPLIAHFQGHIFPVSPTFGLPCPTTIFTFGILLFLQQRIPFFIVFIPLLWTIIGTSAAMMLGMVEDYGLIISGVIYIVMRNFHLPENEPLQLKD